MATPSFQHVLIIGATSGIGSHLAKSYHAQGKKVIATGRRAERLAKLKEECPGVETYQVFLSVFLLDQTKKRSLMLWMFLPLKSL